MSSPQDVQTALHYVDRALHEVREMRRRSNETEADLTHIRDLLMDLHPGNPLSPLAPERRNRP